MDSFERPHIRLTLEEVAQRTNLPKSTTYRILAQLVRMNWLDHSARGYSLGWRSLELGGREIGHSTMRAAAAPHLHALALRTGMVVHLAALDGTEIYYLDKVGGRAAVHVPSKVGGRAPAHCTALGKSMLAWTAPEELDEMYAHGLARCTPRSISDVGILHRELGRIRRRQGLAVDNDEFAIGIKCVGVALRGPTGPVGAISAVGAGHVSVEQIRPVVMATARSVMADLLGG